MSMKHIIVSAVVFALVPIGGIAIADIAPPRIHPVAPPRVIPDALKDTFKRLEVAFRDKDVDLARREIDPRGWDKNLVGGSGAELSSLVAQGIRKGWYLRPNWKTYRTVGPAVIVSADVVQIEDARVSDKVDVVLVEGTEAHWRLLGAGEDAAQVELLAERVRRKQPLEPPPAPTKDAP